MAKRKKVAMHSFYCPKCGNFTMDLPRNTGMRKEGMHRKKLYCPWCKETLNQIEITTPADLINFREAFERGDFINESQESLDFVRSARLG